MKKTIPAHRPIYPTPAAMVVSLSAEGKPNIITLGEVFNVSLGKPPILGIAVRKATYSHGLISASREFTVNLPTLKILKQVDFCGSVSGRSVDKFKESGLTALPAQMVGPPLIAECPVNLECRCVGIHEVGDHDLFLGEVVLAHAEESILDGSGMVDYAALDTFCFMFHFGSKGEYWALGGKVRDAFFMRKSNPQQSSPGQGKAAAAEVDLSADTVAPESENKPRFAIRPVAEGDFQGISRLNGDLGYDYPLERIADRIRRIQRDTQDRMLCAADGPELFGYIHLSPYELLYSDPLINILALVVRSDRRGQGVGKALIRAAENLAREEGYAGIRLVSGFDRIQAHGFYEAQGFTLRKEQKNYIKFLRT